MTVKSLNCIDCAVWFRLSGWDVEVTSGHLDGSFWQVNATRPGRTITALARSEDEAWTAASDMAGRALAALN